MIYTRDSIKILIEKRFRVDGLPNYITVRSKGMYSISPMLLQKDAEIVSGEERESKELKILARVDLVRVAVHYLGVEHEAIAVENVMCKSTAAAYQEATSYNKDEWILIHMEGTKHWDKENSED